MMETLLNATDVRKNWGHFIDTVVRVRPQFVKRNRDTFVAVASDHLKILLVSHRLKREPFKPHASALTAGPTGGPESATRLTPPSWPAA